MEKEIKYFIFPLRIAYDDVNIISVIYPPFLDSLSKKGRKGVNTMTPLTK